jgi:2-oxoglutarate dehydrogenase E2 component (dihydrolipoamide succinyltransferase)
MSRVVILGIAGDGGEELMELERWLKDDGAIVEAGDTLCILSTDKASMELSADRTGILRHLKKAGETVEPYEEVARIDPLPRK